MIDIMHEQIFTNPVFFDILDRYILTVINKRA